MRLACKCQRGKPKKAANRKKNRKTQHSTLSETGRISDTTYQYYLLRTTAVRTLTHMLGLLLRRPTSSLSKAGVEWTIQGSAIKPGETPTFSSLSSFLFFSFLFPAGRD
ncbi:uncharacterized protein TrAFT101_000939 [Trichoderma asperellum]|uniref:uncharacterized protein n=1 Tax=Trichoderma asperellum TaxID=101201 RepID=UPI00332070CB|nr:hypothetical protein TrAFT101_000939 [Trichoderma asperellum]